MNNELVEELRSQLENVMQNNRLRYNHSIGVAHTCACLAMRYGVDMERAFVAGLMHDIAKCLNDEITISECNQYHLEISEYESKAPYLLHGKLGAYYAKHRYHINDDEICSAIKYHTTGHPAMSQLEMILFIADYIEPFRNKAPNLEQLRSAAFESLEKGVCFISRATLQYLEKTHSIIDPASLETYEYYKQFE